MTPFLSSVQAFKSTDGGKTWTTPVFVASINEHAVSGGMRALPLMGAQIDASGKVYVVWADCSFRTNCSSNDIVMSTSTNGTTWTAPARIPVDPVKHPRSLHSRLGNRVRNVGQLRAPSPDVRRISTSELLHQMQSGRRLHQLAKWWRKLDGSENPGEGNQSQLAGLD